MTVRCCCFTRRYDRLHQHPHPNILTVFGICCDFEDQRVRLVMEYCAKGSLFDLLQRQGVEVRCDGVAQLVCFARLLAHLSHAPA
jgi:hypothetical protein